MVVYKDPKPLRFTEDDVVEKHFHDHDETWFIMGGKCMAYMVDRSGEKSEFILEKGDIWMVEAGVEHWCDAIGEVLIFPVPGTFPEGSHTMGHYYMEKEKYMPSLKIVKDPLDRYDSG
jgi:hypothetical protein